jgi:hypothetical protein
MVTRTVLLGGTDWSDGEVFDAADQNSTINSVTGSGNIIIPIFIPEIQTSGTWTATQNSGSLYGGSILSNGAADNDEATWTISPIPGTYRMDIIFGKDANQGIVDIDIDGTEVDTFDTYDASVLDDLTRSTTGISVTSTGTVPFTIRVDGKNASSSAHKAKIQFVSLTRVGP